MSRGAKNARFFRIGALIFTLGPVVTTGADTIPWMVVFSWIIIAEVWAAADWLLKAARGEE